MSENKEFRETYIPSNLQARNEEVCIDEIMEIEHED